MKAFLLLAVGLLSACGSSDRERTVFFPAEVGGGKLSVFKYSTTYVPVKNERWDYSNQKIELSFFWQDGKDELKTLTGIWMPEAPPGHYVIGAERKAEKIVFTLTREGDKRPFATSEPFTILQAVHFEGVVEDKTPNQSLQPTAASRRG
jgi:hypothetical protein